MKVCGNCADWTKISDDRGACWSADRLDGDLSQGAADTTSGGETCEAWISRADDDVICKHA